jgi:hypothetical protein
VIGDLVERCLACEAEGVAEIFNSPAFAKPTARQAAKEYKERKKELKVGLASEARSTTRALAKAEERGRSFA